MFLKGANAPTSPYRTLIEALEHAPENKKFVTMWDGTDGATSITFAEFINSARAQMDLLEGYDVRPDDRVILIMPQGIELMTAFVGAMLLGAVPAILAYPNFKAEPIKYRTGLAGVSENLGARLVVIDKAFPTELLDSVSLQGGTKVLRSRGMHPRAPASLKALREMDPEKLAFIQHSAGTTGLQKGVALSHAAVLRQLAHLGDVLRVQASDRLYSWLPLYHDMGLISCFMLPMVYHLEIVMQSPTDWVMQPGTMLSLMSEHRCTLAWLPNFAFQFLARRVRREDVAGVDLSSIRMLINCSEPVRAESF